MIAVASYLCRLPFPPLTIPLLLNPPNETAVPRASLVFVVEESDPVAAQATELWAVEDVEDSLEPGGLLACVLMVRYLLVGSRRK